MRAYAAKHKRRLRTYMKGYHLRQYGLTRAQYESMCADRNNLCEICHSPPTGAGSGHLVVDHCHISGRVSGLLCGECNSAIGLLKEDPCIARRAAEYLERK